jgi:hypothetical protein
MSQGSPAHNLSIGHRRQPSDALSRDEELCIIHHYTTQTFKTFSRRDDESEVWRNEVFRDGPKYPFLLDLVIALAALHKAFTEPAEAEKYAAASLYYQTQGLQAYQGQLMDINEENCHAVFAFSGMINGLNIAMSRGCASLPPTSPIDTLCLSLKLLRGVQLVLSTKLDVLMSTRYRAVLSPKDLQEETGTSEEVAAALQELREIVTDKPQLTTIGCAELYISTINSLERQFRHAEQDDDLAVIIAWPLMIGEEPIELLKQRNPMMMLIFAHYGVLYSRIHDIWWAHDFGYRLIWDLATSLQALGSAWVPLVAWVKSKVSGAHYSCPSSAES